MLIEDMETDHIIKCINMLERNGQEYTRAYEGLCREINHRIQNNMTNWGFEVSIKGEKYEN